MLVELEWANERECSKGVEQPMSMAVMGADPKKEHCRGVEHYRLPKLMTLED